MFKRGQGSSAIAATLVDDHVSARSHTCPATPREIDHAASESPDTLPQRQQPDTRPTRRIGRSCASTALKSLERRRSAACSLPSTVVPRLSARVYAAPFNYGDGVHCPPRERRRRQLDRQSQRLRVRESTSAYLRATRFLRGSAMSRACVAQRMRL